MSNVITATAAANRAWRVVQLAAAANVVEQHSGYAGLEDLPELAQQYPDATWWLLDRVTSRYTGLRPGPEATEESLEAVYDAADRLCPGHARPAPPPLDHAGWLGLARRAVPGAAPVALLAALRDSCGTCAGVGFVADGDGFAPCGCAVADGDLGALSPRRAVVRLGAAVAAEEVCGKCGGSGYVPATLGHGSDDLDYFVLVPCGCGWGQGPNDPLLPAAQRLTDARLGSAPFAAAGALGGDNDEEG